MTREEMMNKVTPTELLQMVISLWRKEAPAWREGRSTHFDIQLELRLITHLINNDEFDDPFESDDEVLRVAEQVDWANEGF